MTKVIMLASVGHEKDSYVAGEEYDLPDELGDSFIAKEYAEGELSRPHSDDEIAEMKGNSQVVGT